jgi:pimeloyl-ACP methyl ester carboxylesterase
MPGPLELIFEVTDGTGDGARRHRLAAWLWSPPASATAMSSLVICFHGGGYTRSYFHLDVSGHGSYSMAEHLAEAGHIVVVFDQPGVGDSSRPPDGSTLTVDTTVAADEALCAQLIQAVREGTLTADLVPHPDLTTTGVGHSLGASLLTVQQARFGSFDRIAVLGATNLPRSWGGEFSFQVSSGYASFDRSGLRSGFYWDDVAAEVIACDEALGVEMPVGVLPAPEVAAAEAGLIDVPVFICFGERDISPDPHAEPQAFAGSRDVTLLVLSASGHCSNFSSGRRVLWDRLGAWIRATPAADRQD